MNTLRQDGYKGMDLRWQLSNRPPPLPLPPPLLLFFPLSFLIAYFLAFCRDRDFVALVGFKLKIPM